MGKATQFSMRAIIAVALVTGALAQAQWVHAADKTAFERFVIGGRVARVERVPLERLPDNIVMRQPGAGPVSEPMSPSRLSVSFPIQANVGQGPAGARFVMRSVRSAAVLMDDGFAVAAFDQDGDPEALSDTAPIVASGTRSPRPVFRSPQPLDNEVARRVPAELVAGRRQPTDIPVKGYRMRLRFVDAKRVTPVPEQPTKTQVRSYIGNDKSEWVPSIQAYTRVGYRGLWDGVDLTVSAPNGAFAYALRLDDGKAVDAIEIAVEGARSLEIDKRGALVMHTDRGPFVQTPPRFAKQIGGRPEKIDGRFVLKSEKSFGFAIDERDYGGPLIIDPTIVMTTYYGGTGQEGMLGTDQGSLDFINRGFDVAMGTNGNAYVVGRTASADFPITGGPEINGSIDAFVMRIDPVRGCDPSGICYAVYIGGSSSDRGRGIAVAPDGRAFITGHTSSSDFPTHGDAIHPTRSQSGGFIARLSPDGAFEVGTYVGSGSDHHPNAIVFAAAEGGESAVLIGGSARGAPTGPELTAAFQTDFMGGQFDGFVARVDPDLESYDYFTLIGGTRRDVIADIDQRNGEAYVVGHTTSLDFPVTAYGMQTEHSRAESPDGCAEATPACSDAFVARFSAGGDALAFSTFLGGEMEDYARGIAVSANGQPVVVGGTRNPDEPSEASIFVKRLSSLGADLLQNMVKPGEQFDHGEEVVIDATDRAHVTGTISRDGLTTGDGSLNYQGGSSDIFYLRLPPGTDQPDYFTYLGGRGEDRGFAVAAYGDGETEFCSMIVGSTRSEDVAAVNAVQPNLAGPGADILLNVICDIPPDIVIEDGEFFKTVSRSQVEQGENVTFTVTVLNGSDFDVPAQLVDVVPFGLTVTGLTGPGCGRVGNTVTCEDGFVLGPGATTVAITARADVCGMTLFNTAKLTVGGNEIVTAPSGVSIACQDEIPPPPPPVCGDGVVSGNEECDGGLNCLPGCTIRPGSCTASSQCGSGEVCGRGCYGSSSCFGFEIDGVCYGLVVSDDEILCDVDFICLNPASAVETID